MTELPTRVLTLGAAGLARLAWSFDEGHIAARAARERVSSGALGDAFVFWPADVPDVELDHFDTGREAWPELGFRAASAHLHEILVATPGGVLVVEDALAHDEEIVMLTADLPWAACDGAVVFGVTPATSTVELIASLVNAANSTRLCNVVLGTCSTVPLFDRGNAITKDVLAEIGRSVIAAAGVAYDGENLVLAGPQPRI